jgi:hypothetical protein
VWNAVLAFLPFSSALAAGPDAPLTVESLPQWWAAPGTPGFSDDYHMGNSLPFAYLGLVAGGVAVRDGLLPSQSPWPGVDEIQAPMAWYDSAAVVVGEGAGWNGFSSSLVELRSFAAPPRGGKPRAAMTLVSGSSGIDRNGLRLERGDHDDWIRAGALEETRQGTGLLGLRGQHVWFMDIGRIYGRQTFAGSFSQRGAANNTRRDERYVNPFAPPPPWVGIEESAHGESGAAWWSWEHGDRKLTARFERSHDHRESFESPTTDVITSFAEREAQQNTFALEAARGVPGHMHGLRLEFTRGQVSRSEDAIGPQPARTNEQRTAWLAARFERPWLKGTLEAQAGAGYARAADQSRERLQAAPSLVWRAGQATRRVRLYAERVVTPLWSDLAPGVVPFTQDAWVAGFDLSAGDPARAWLELGGLGADIGGHALLTRWPVRDLSLRYGWTPDDVRSQDAMLTVAGGVHRGGLSLDASGFGRVRPRALFAAQVDPAVGARAAAEAAFRAFSGDLGVKLRLESAWVGERENASLPEYFVQPRPIAGYATSGASLALTLGDARMVLSATNLEDVPHPQIWTDLSSPFPGTPAVGSGRQYRFEVAWPFFN